MSSHGLGVLKRYRGGLRVPEELREHDGSEKRAEAIRIFFRDGRVLRMLFVICAGLLQGAVVFCMNKAPLAWHWYITAALLPLPFYLAGKISKRLGIAMIPWCALLILLDSGQIFLRNPYGSYLLNGTEVSFFAMAYAGALLSLPNFVSWIDGGGAFPEWQISFRHFSRMFFASILAGLFLLLFYGVFTIGAGLAMVIGGFVRNLFRWVVRNFVILAFAAWGAAFYWTAGTKRLLDVLERYILALFSCILPFLSLFTLGFIAVLPMGVERLWDRGVNSGVVLSVFLAAGLCAFAAWQGGVNEDGRPREPFFRPVDTFVRAAFVALPIFCPLLVYTIGLRVGQYSWTVDRAISMVLATAFGLWSLAWAFFLVRRRKEWPAYYGKVNRIAFPIIAAAFILLASPLCDVRRIILRERLEWFRESIQKGADIDGFDWRYIARNLGVYGVGTMEEIERGGAAGLIEKFGPFESDSRAEKIMERISSAVTALKNEHERRAGRGMDGESVRKITAEEFILSAREAPVFGGELSPEERESLARRLPESFVDERIRRTSDAKIDYFYLADMNGDGKNETLFGLDSDIYLLKGDSAFRLALGYARDSGRSGNYDNKAAISDDRQRIIRNQWGMIQINGRIFFVEPSDAEKIESAANTPND
jgi:hypothetical protein